MYINLILEAQWLMVGRDKKYTPSPQIDMALWEEIAWYNYKLTHMIKVGLQCCMITSLFYLRHHLCMMKPSIFIQNYRNYRFVGNYCTVC